MAQYNADIRVGITGKTQLNALEKQLGRINKDLVKINKGLKAQTLTINTKGATRALDQLDSKINKLNRTINVNANINEKRTGSGGSGGGGFNAAALASVSRSAMPLSELKQREQISKQMLKDAKDRARDGAQAQAEVKKILDTMNELETANQELTKAQTAYADKTEKIADLTRQRNVALGQAKGIQTKLNKGFFKGEESIAKQKKLMAKYKTDASDLSSQIGNANKGFGNRNKLLEKANRLSKQFNDQQKELDSLVERTAKKQIRRQKVNKGLKAGFGVAAASAAGNIPVLGDAVTGGLVAGLSGGSVAAGALAGGLVGVGVALVGVTADVTKFNNELLKQQRALANTVATSDELKAALGAVDQASQDFLVPIGEATAQFTKLNAAARASGFTVEEVEEVYRGLAAANTALGGDSERLQGILLATQQVFSKGKVQAEELRGQIGERLPGAFALFAKAVGKTPAELDKALEKGEVSLQDFVTFSRSLLERYEEDAKKIADAPENAAARLKLAMDDLKRAIGPILTGIGNFFIQLANTIVKQLTRMFDAINNARASQALAGQREAQAGRDEAAENLRRQQERFSTSDNKATDRSNPAYNALVNATKGYEMATRALNQANKNVAATKLPFEATGKPLEEKLTPTPTTPTGGSSGGSGSGPRDSQAGQMQRDLELSLAQNKLAESTLGIYGRELEQLELVNREIEARLTYQKELADIAADDLYADERAIAIQQAKADLDRELIRIAGDRLAIENEIDKAKKEGLKPLEQEKAVLEALVNKGPEAAEQVRLQQQAADIAEGLGDQYYEDVLNLLKGNAALRKRQELLQEQREMWNQIGQAVGQAIEDTLVRGIAAAVSEAENLSDVLSDIGRQLLSTVGRILINSAINSAAGPGGLFGADGLPGFQQRAEGGPINAGQPYLVGEQGPELVIPGAAGTVIPNDAFSAATQALQSNGRGTAAGVDGTASQGEAFAVANGARSISTETSRTTSTMNMFREYEERVINNPEPLKVDYQSTVINNQTYVTEEQFQKGLTQSSNRARQATIRDLRNNPASRKMAGVNR